MSTSSFCFKQFTIHQDKCAMKVGTDAVLLGAWANTEGVNQVLDIGTGTGVIGIMMAQKNHDATIDAIDIDENAYQQALDNAWKSPWSNRINIYHTSLQFYAAHSLKKYDLIVSNPPYFIAAPKPYEEARGLARHTDDSLNFDELTNLSKDLLTKDGRLCVVLPLTEGNLFIEKALKVGLYCTKCVFVKTKNDKPVKRLLMQFEKENKELTKEELVIQDQEMRYTNQYIELTQEFYLGLKEYRNYTS